VNPGRALSMINNLNANNFDSEVSSIENALKNKCLERNLSGNSSIDNIMSKVFDPTASKFANQNTAGFLKDKIKQIMENPKTSPEKKLAELRSLENQTQSRYYLKMDSSYEVQDVDASGKLV